MKWSLKYKHENSEKITVCSIQYSIGRSSINCPDYILLWHKMHLVLKFKVSSGWCRVVSDCKYFPGWRCNVCVWFGSRREWPGPGGSRHVTTSGSPSSVPWCLDQCHDNISGVLGHLTSKLGHYVHHQNDEPHHQNVWRKGPCLKIQTKEEMIFQYKHSNMKNWRTSHNNVKRNNIFHILFWKCRW